MKKVDIWRSTNTVENSKGAFLDMFKVLTSNADTKDGLRPNCIFADEPHAYPDGSLYNVLSEGMAHRASGFAMMLSTAGYNKQGFFHKKLQYAEDAMSGAINDPSMYLMSFAVTDDDNWEDEESWIKTNPALGFGVKMSYLRSKFTKALHSATDEVSFKTKHLNMWTDSAIAWIKDRDWKASYTAPVNEEDFVGKEC